jgi:hypothetical protein
MQRMLLSELRWILQPSKAVLLELMPGTQLLMQPQMELLNKKKLRIQLQIQPLVWVKIQFYN